MAATCWSATLPQPTIAIFNMVDGDSDWRRVSTLQRIIVSVRCKLAQKRLHRPLHWDPRLPPQPFFELLIGIAISLPFGGTAAAIKSRGKLVFRPLAVLLPE